MYVIKVLENWVDVSQFLFVTSFPSEADAVEGSIQIISPEVHDVAIVFDWLSKTFITAGETIDVCVMVENQGDYVETTTV